MHKSIKYGKPNIKKTPIQLHKIQFNGKYLTVYSNFFYKSVNSRARWFCLASKIRAHEPTGLLPTGIRKCKCRKQSQMYKAAGALAPWYFQIFTTKFLFMFNQWHKAIFYYWFNYWRKSR